MHPGNRPCPALASSPPPPGPRPPASRPRPPPLLCDARRLAGLRAGAALPSMEPLSHRGLPRLSWIDTLYSSTCPGLGGAARGAGVVGVVPPYLLCNAASRRGGMLSRGEMLSWAGMLSQGGMCCWGGMLSRAGMLSRGAMLSWAGMLCQPSSAGGLPG